MVDEAQQFSGPSEVMTTTEVMQYLKVTRKTVLKLVKEGKIPAQKVGKDFRYLKSEIDEFLKGDKGSSSSVGKSYFT